MTNFSDL